MGGMGEVSLSRLVACERVGYALEILFIVQLVSYGLTGFREKKVACLCCRRY